MGVGALKLETEAWSAYRRQIVANPKVTKVGWEPLKRGPEQDDHAIAHKIRPYEL